MEAVLYHLGAAALYAAAALLVSFLVCLGVGRFFEAAAGHGPACWCGREHADDE